MDELEIIGPVGVRKFALEKACEQFSLHAHNYDHMMLCMSGRLRVTIDGNYAVEIGPGESTVIKAGTGHEGKALEPNTRWHCIFSHRDFDRLVSQEYTGNPEAYV